jgi:hypothetical protein
MSGRATFLHITDPHVSARGVPFERDDQKVQIPEVPKGTREHALALLFRRLVERLDREACLLDGVLFSGDAQSRGEAGGHEFVLELLTENLGPLGLTTGQIVAVPGNHDVPRESLPSSPERYENFVKTWRDHGCVVPWLDGIDAWPALVDVEKHRLVAPDQSWAVFPINTSNWSHVTSVLPEPLRSHWDAIPETVAAGDPTVAAKLRSQLQALARYDMARVSEHQLEALLSPRPRNLSMRDSSALL